MVPCSIWFWVENCRDCNGDVHVMFCATHWDRVWNIWPYQPALHVFAILQLQCKLKLWSFDHSNILFMSSSILFIIKPALTYYHMPCGWVPPLLHLPGVKFIDTTPSPESMFYFHVVTTSVIALLIMPCWHATYTKIKAKTKAIKNVNNCIQSCWRVVTTLV